MSVDLASLATLLDDLDNECTRFFSLWFDESTPFEIVVSFFFMSVFRFTARRAMSMCRSAPTQRVTKSIFFRCLAHFSSFSAVFSFLNDATTSLQFSNAVSREKLVALSERLDVIAEQHSLEHVAAPAEGAGGLAQLADEQSQRNTALWQAIVRVHDQATLALSIVSSTTITPLTLPSTTPATMISSSSSAIQSPL